MTARATATIRSQRLNALPPYLFVEIDRAKRAKIASGADVIDLGVGDPDRPTPSFIIDALAEAARDPANHRYPPSIGTPGFRESAARFMKRRFGVDADPDRHICQCIGSKDGIAHLPLAVVDPGDVVLAPRPGYPVYQSGAAFAGAEVFDLRLAADTGWTPRLQDVPATIASRAKLIWANYPNNPTAACVDVAFFERYIAFADRHGIIAASDLAYSEVWFDQPPPSMWQADNADLDTTLGIEFHSLSKAFNMTGWRCAFAVGHPEVISALAAIKGNCDSGQFGAIQHAGAVALDHYDHPDVVAMRDVYRQRRDVVVPGLREFGCAVENPRAGFFVWARCPPGPDGEPMDSMAFAARALEEADVVLVPGAGFGPDAATFFRIALTVEVDRLAEAMQRLKTIDFRR
ncbi:MAG: aminotransferase class I/II-fold pyridoxal phosphate-dependent enzyme [Planctomycetes bacterium]|nr:aminotransferase class I/II-fold pyridoxal phosphate-dependent enzyme [Planctomycetota bacterium]